MFALKTSRKKNLEENSYHRLKNDETESSRKVEKEARGNRNFRAKKEKTQ
jgi:hypothetical protein